ncbi:MAG: Tetratricopeptide TPR_2 [Marinimicrobia bacterium 46_47]|nr:MAG: Tetratricopeptide TPR_2 [Marinimicrobia bacterium 46_47]KUK93783.1 MAG: Tetratricopeptide TPR_2 [Marinimicrobia bacterium 46_43]
MHSWGSRLVNIYPGLVRGFAFIFLFLLIFGCNNRESWDESYARGQMLYRQGHYQEALRHASISLNAARHFEEVDQYRILQSLYLLASINDQLKKHETADHFYSRCLSMIRDLDQADIQQTYTIYRDYSRFLHRLNDIRGALAINAELLEYLKAHRHRDQISPEKLGQLYFDQALYYTAYEKYESALSYIQWAVKILENHYGSTSPRLVDPLYLLSTVYYHLGNYHLGRQTAELGLEIASNRHDVSKQKEARLLIIAARNMRGQKAVPTARNHYEAALNLLDPSTGVYTPELEKIYGGLSELSMILNEPLKAVSYQILAANTSEALWGKTHSNTLRQLVKLSDLYRHTGDEENALRIEYEVRQRISSLIN